MQVTRGEVQRLADEDLMPLIAREDPLAFEVFYDRHAGASYSLAYRIVGSRTAAEDVTQEALLSIWRSGARYDRARGSVRSWTLGIVRNRAIDLLRKESGRSPKLAAGGDEILERRAAEELTDVEAVRRETAHEVRGAIKELPDDQSRVIRARLLRRLQPFRDRGDAQRAPRDHQGADAPRHGQDQGDRRGGLVTGEHPDRDDLVAFALGALEQGDERAVEAHVPSCARCTRELEALVPAVAVLGESVEQLEPPPSCASGCSLSFGARRPASASRMRGPSGGSDVACADSCFAPRSHSRPSR